MKNCVVGKAGVCAVLAVVLCGCQLIGPSDEELIGGTMGVWKRALVGHDVEEMMEVYSEDFRASNGNDKEAVRELITWAVNEGFMDGVEVNLEEAETVIEDGKATVYPVVLTGHRIGQLTYGFTLEKKDGAWVIVGSREY
jgi:hypothetical protein